MLFKVNKWVYSSDTVWLATKISQVEQVSVRSTTESLKLIYEFLVGEPPKQWFSTSTLATWHKDVSQIQVKELLFCAQKVSSYGVMIDESTRGETKQFVVCLMFWNSDKNFLVAQITHLKDIKCCNGETIAKTVKEIIQASNLDVQNCLIKHPAMLLMLAWDFKYQFPFRTHWKYELIAAKQYLERYGAHIKFTSQFITMLEKCKNTPKAYLEKRKLFNSWLLDPILNEVLDLLNEQEFEKIIQDLEQGLEKAIHVTLEDFKVKNCNDFGLYKKITEDINFQCEFEDYCITKNSVLYKFPQIYDKNSGGGGGGDGGDGSGSGGGGGSGDGGGGGIEIF
ncbi:hypothetical protein C2G38_2205546 [Gigaspora rosea]|uniref:Uncharacterized protein n=1 Tax=Gigaspora rosea TaxID=44941 RepID=A0A397UPJ5_9GLOM|nr:hypothetical protein C2G38_2205546 [Gigaspora rosea]